MTITPADSGYDMVEDQRGSMTPDQLFTYADRFARRHEADGRGTIYPTMRQVAKRFRVAYDEIEDACQIYQGEGYLGLVVAIGIQGHGYADITPRGEQQVEAYK